MMLLEVTVTKREEQEDTRGLKQGNIKALMKGIKEELCLSHQVIALHFEYLYLTKKDLYFKLRVISTE